MSWLKGEDTDQGPAVSLHPSLPGGFRCLSVALFDDVVWIGAGWDQKDWCMLETDYLCAQVVTPAWSQMQGFLCMQVHSSHKYHRCIVCLYRVVYIY